MAVASVLTRALRQLPRLILAYGYILHLRRNDAFASVVHLADVPAGQGTSGLAQVGEAQSA